MSIDRTPLRHTNLASLVLGAAALLANPVVRNVLAYERDVDTPFHLAVLHTVLGQPLGWPTVGPTEPHRSQQIPRVTGNTGRAQVADRGQARR